MSCYSGVTNLIYWMRRWLTSGQSLGPLSAQTPRTSPSYLHFLWQSPSTGTHMHVEVRHGLKKTVRTRSKTGVNTDRQVEQQRAAGSPVYLVWSEAQGPQGSTMSIHSLQEASWCQLKDLQLPALTRTKQQNILSSWVCGIFWQYDRKDLKCWTSMDFTRKKTITPG